MLIVQINSNSLLSFCNSDNGGMREAWGALKKFQSEPERLHQREKRLPGLMEYSSDQLFFMSFANMWCETKTISALAAQLKSDPHSPGPVRVKAVTSNMQEFQDAFKCKIGDKNVREKKCIVW